MMNYKIETQNANNPYKTKGIYFDLFLIYQDLNKRFFSNEIKALLKWGKKKSPPLQSKSSIRLGSYHNHKKTIIINPCLDQAIVPQICLERILFHEMAHQKFPIKKGPSGRNLIHYAEFYDFEKNYPYLKEADLWLKTNLSRLLKY